MERRCVGSQGQALPVMMLVMTLAVVGIVVITRLSVAADASARARTAADAAALGGAAEGREAAAQLAEANGGELIEFDRVGANVEVVVRVDSAYARARAAVRVVWTRGP
jgi:hypothetical protein